MIDLTHCLRTISRILPLGPEKYNLLQASLGSVTQEGNVSHTIPTSSKIRVLCIFPDTVPLSIPSQIPYVLLYATT